MRLIRGVLRRFVFTRSATAPSGAHLRTGLWSDTPLMEPVEVLTSLPTDAPEVRAGRPLLYGLIDNRVPNAQSVQKFLDDFKGIRDYIRYLGQKWNFSPAQKQGWETYLDKIDACQRRPAQPNPGFWPLTPQDVVDWLSEGEGSDEGHAGEGSGEGVGQPVPCDPPVEVESMEVVEERVRREVAAEERAFVGLHAGEAPRRYVNTRPEDAKLNNIVVMDVSVDEGEEVFDELGVWEGKFLVGLVKRVDQATGADECDTLVMTPYEPYHADSDGNATIPLWLHKESHPEVDTSWEAVVGLPWKLIDAYPLEYAKRLHEADPNSGPFNPSRTYKKDEYHGVRRKVFKCKRRDGGFLQRQPRSRAMYVMTTTRASERRFEGTMRFDDSSLLALRELATVSAT